MKALLRIINSPWPAIVVAGLLILLSALGSFIPQNRPLDFYWQAFGNNLATILTAFDLQNLYSSWLFRSLLILMALNLLFCAAKTFVTMKTAQKKINFQPEQILDLTSHLDFKVADSNDFWQRAEKIFQPEKFSQKEAGPLKVMWRKQGRLTPYALLAIHLSVWFFIMAALVFSFFGLAGNIVLLAGQTATLETGPKQYARLTLEKFEITPIAQSPLEEYKSYLMVEKTGQARSTHLLTVNQPLRLGGLSVYQEGFGQTENGENASILLVRSDSESLLVWLAVFLMLAGLIFYYQGKFAVVVLWFSEKEQQGQLAVKCRNKNFSINLLNKWRKRLSEIENKGKINNV